MVNNTIPIVNVKNAPFYIQKFSIRILSNIFKDEGYQILSLKNDILIGVLEGPSNTSFENGYFLFRIIFPEDYLFRPPKFIFITQVFHPNISESGNVSVDILLDQWAPTLCSFSSIIYSIQSLLDDPNPNDFYMKQLQNYIKKIEKIMIKLLENIPLFLLIIQNIWKM